MEESSKIPSFFRNEKIDVLPIDLVIEYLQVLKELLEFRNSSSYCQVVYNEVTIYIESNLEIHEYASCKEDPEMFKHNCAKIKDLPGLIAKRKKQLYYLKKKYGQATS